MVVGEAFLHRALRCLPTASVVKNFSGSPMPAKARTLRRPMRLQRVRGRLEAGRATAGSPLVASDLRWRRRRRPCRSAGALARAQAALRAARAADRPERRNALPEPRRASITTIERVLAQRRILQSVIHHDDVRAGGSRAARRRRRDRAHDHGRHAREQKRLVADIAPHGEWRDRPALARRVVPP